MPRLDLVDLMLLHLGLGSGLGSNPVWGRWKALPSPCLQARMSCSLIER